MDERERAQDAREAGERRAALAELGVPADAVYHWMDVASAGPGDVTARYGVVLPDGRLGLVTQHPLVELPGQAWPRPYRITVYGVPAGHVEAIARMLAAAGLSTRGRALPVFEMHPWGTHREAVRLIPLRVTAHHPATPLVAERRLRADLSWLELVPRPEGGYTAAQKAIAEAGLPHLREWVARHAGGRPPGTGKRHRLTVLMVMRAYLGITQGPDGWAEPTIAMVADRLGADHGAPLVSEPTLKRWLGDHRRRWPPSGWREWPDFLEGSARRGVFDPF